MKNLTDFKKRLIPGTELTVQKHVEFNQRDENGMPIYYTGEPQKRVVKKVRTKDVCMTMENGREIWLEFPKVKDCTFAGNSITILTKDLRPEVPTSGQMIPFLTYTFIN